MWVGANVLHRWLTYLKVTCSCCASFLLLFHFDNTKIDSFFELQNFYFKNEIIFLFKYIEKVK